MIRPTSIAPIMSRHREKVRELERQIRQAEWDLVDDIMSDLEAPIEDEMWHILDEQEKEIIDKINLLPEGITEPETGGELLTIALIFDAALWFTETVNRLAAYAHNTMIIGYRFGLAQIGKEKEPDIRDEFVRDVMRELERWNYKITDTTVEGVQKIVDIALVDRMSRDQFKTEIRDLFGKWKVHRPAGVSVFNVTYPFNESLFRSYINHGVPYKQWISQRDHQVRRTHIQADGQIQRLSDKFQVGNALLMYPGDLTQLQANPEELWGCRCAIRPILDPLGAPE